MMLIGTHSPTASQYSATIHPFGQTQTATAMKVILFSIWFSPSRNPIHTLNKAMKRKLASLAFQAVAYAALGYAFYFLFFASQL